MNLKICYNNKINEQTNAGCKKRENINEINKIKIKELIKWST